MVLSEEIIKECRQYNKFAQKMLYEKYAPAMRGVCLRYINDTHTVNDLIQEGFLKVFSNIKQFSGNGSFEGWMKRIFINTTISHLRKQQKTNRFMNIEDIEDFVFIDHNASSIENDKTKIDRKDLSDEQIDFELVVNADFSEVELLNVLIKVPEKYRTVFNLYCIENVKHEEISSMLGIDVTTSRTRLLRARTIIQKELYKMSIEKLGV